MRARWVWTALFLALAWPAAARADLTPDGPATLFSVYHGPRSVVGSIGGQALVGWKATVGPGGRAGTVQAMIGTALSPPVTLPAEPGTYTFALPAPHPDGELTGLVQTTGGHALLGRPGRAGR